jgi:membrane protein required for colicin V production
MNLFDIGILMVMALFTVRGFVRGIIQEAATLIGVIISFFLAAFYYGQAARLLAPTFPDHGIFLSFFCFIFLFGFCWLLFHFLGIMAKKMIRLTLLGWVDRGFGGVFGLLKGAIIIFILVSLVTFFMPKSKPIVGNSRLYPHVLAINQKLTHLIPSRVSEDYFARKRELLEYWEAKEKSIRKLQRHPLNDKSR